ncbi:DUF6531 domain-containing protein [Agaribacterium sp. ZY112]|uniref:DUF6531 domain-containing protein n=1 Tax=Agaribacterium sp. ZY112 TaxID=3233574 RepID=UPI0035255577
MWRNICKAVWVLAITSTKCFSYTVNDPSPSYTIYYEWYNSREEAVQRCKTFVPGVEPVCFGPANVVQAGWVQSPDVDTHDAHFLMAAHPMFYLSGAQSYFPTCPVAGNPINLNSGYKVQEELDFSSQTFQFSRFYSSSSDYPGRAIGLNWRHSFDYSLDGIVPLHQAESVRLLSGGTLSTAPPVNERYNSPEEACNLGWLFHTRWEYLGGSLAVGTSSRLIGDRQCEILKSGDVVARFLIKSDFGISVASLPSSERESIKTVTVPNGNTYVFIWDDDVYEPQSGQPVVLKKNEHGWMFIDEENNIVQFQDGLISSVLYSGGTKYSIKRDSLGYIEAIERNGEDVLIFEYNDKYLIEKIKSSDKEIFYTYDDLSNLSTVSNGEDGVRYLYEDTRFPSALTARATLAGKKRSSWIYDAKGRAVSSYLGDGQQRVDIEYADFDDAINPKVNVTNSLGKTTVYHYTTGLLSRRIESIVGQETSNCLESNTSYKYTENGRLSKVTDSRGYVTTYLYNERGLQVKKIQAVGTTEENIIETEWHPTLNLPEKVTTDTSISTYKYDSKGRMLSNSVEPTDQGGRDLE